MSGKENSLLYHGKPICFGEGVIIEGTTDSFDPDVEALGGFWLLDPFGVGRGGYTQGQSGWSVDQNFLKVFAQIWGPTGRGWVVVKKKWGGWVWA